MCGMNKLQGVRAEDSAFKVWVFTLGAKLMRSPTSSWRYRLDHLATLCLPEDDLPCVLMRNTCVTPKPCAKWALILKQWLPGQGH